MSFLEILTAVRGITAALKARDWVQLAALVAGFISQMLANRQIVAAAGPDEQAELDAALEEMKAAAKSC